MPPKYSKMRKSKPSLRKAQAVVSKSRKSKAKKNMDTFFFKSKVTAQVTPIQGVAVANYIYNSFSLDPTNFGGAAAYINNAEFNLYRGMYDKFRVNSVKVTFTPKANVLDQNIAQQDATLNLTGDGMVHHCVDRDGLAPSSVARISRYPSYRKTSVLKKFSRTYSVKYPMGIWIDCDSPATFNMTKELGLSGGVTIYAENLLEDNYEAFNEAWASVLVEHNIVFQGKTSGALSGVYDGDNQLVGVQLGFTTADPNLAITPLKNIRGTLDADKRTTDEVTETAITDSATA